MSNRNFKFDKNSKKMRVVSVILTLIVLVVFFVSSFFVGWCSRGCSDSRLTAYADDLTSVSYRSSTRQLPLLGGVNGGLGSPQVGISTNNYSYMFFIDFLLVPSSSISIRFGTYTLNSSSESLLFSDYQTFNLTDSSLSTVPHGLFYKNADGSFLDSPVSASSYSNLYQSFWVGQIEFNNFDSLSKNAPCWSDLSFESVSPRTLAFGPSDSKTFVSNVTDFLVLTVGFSADFNTRSNSIKFYFPCTFQSSTDFLTSLQPFDRVINLNFYVNNVDAYNLGYLNGTSYGLTLSNSEKVDLAYKNGFSAGYDNGYTVGTSVKLKDLTPFEVLISNVNAFFSIKIFGTGVTLGLVCSLLFGLMLFTLALKVFFHS